MVTMAGRYATVDGMRGAAALLVVLYHFQQRYSDFVMPGYLAVDLFFVISGFVIAHIYVPRMQAGETAFGFMRTRLIRLYPLYLAGLLLGVVAMLTLLGTHDPSALSLPGIAGAFATEVLMLPTPFNVGLFPLNGPAWSLFLEMVINLVFALGMWRLRTQRLALLMAGAAVVLLIGVEAPVFFNIGWAWSELGLGMARAVYGFGAGLLIHRWIGHVASRPSRWAALPVLAAIAVIACPATEHRLAWELFCVLALLPALAACATLLEPPPMLHRLFEDAGALSYPLYAIHWPLLLILGPVLQRLPALAGGALFLAVLLPTARLTARYWDAPVRGLLRHMNEAGLPRRLTTRPQPAR